ncbi:30S ribosomal protein S6 [Gemmatimonadetes bacterium T265]|nr:30S ribosomal protein S6 [Gemmatimonadetes bacterium T265]
MPTKATRTYEAVYIFDSALEDAAINEKLERFHGMLGAAGDVNVEHWGRRQLAYTIKKRENGYYAIAHFDLPNVNVLPEYERALKLDDGVLRYLISLHERELGAPPMSEEELARRKANEDDDDEE